MNNFSQENYLKILKLALEKGYKFLTMSEYSKDREAYSNMKVALLRHDIDDKPERTEIFFEVEQALKIKSTNFILTNDQNYNIFSIRNLNLFRQIEAYGSEIALHTNYLETATLLELCPQKVLESQVISLRYFFDIKGLACHRNIDFMVNSLPHLRDNWAEISTKLELEYHAYEPHIVDALTFVNEGLNPHLCWRQNDTKQVKESGQGFCMSTHPHWWHRKHAFE